MQHLTENSAKIIPQGGGKYLAVSFQDILNPPKIEDVDAMDIVRDIASRGGMELIDL